MPVIAILFGAGLTLATAESLGLLLLAFTGLTLSRLERRCLAFVAGSAGLSLILFAVCALHWAHRGVFIAIAALSIGAAVRVARKEPEPAEPPRELPAAWRWTALAIFTAFAIYYLVNAGAPEFSPDGTAYHLAVADHYNRARGFEQVRTSIYFNMPQAAEMLFLMAYAFGRNSSAALVHLAFLPALCGLMFGYARRYGFSKAGLAAAVFIFACPVIGIDATSAYNDVALAAALMAVFSLCQIWADTGNRRSLVLIGALAGFAFGIKYTGFTAAVYAIGFVVLNNWPGFRGIGRNAKPAVLVLAGTALLSMPWAVKNWLWVGNPIAPFGNRIFANPWVHVSFERDYQRGLRTYELTDRSQIPLEVTIRGEKLGGLLGPLFLLSPVAMLSIRKPAGRRLLAAAVLFALPYLDNIGTRFLIPAAPFLSLALALALSGWPEALFGLMIGHAVLSWPAVVDLYCAPAAWRLHEMPVAAALRIEPEDAFLRRQWPGYVTDRLIEQIVPPGQSIFLFGTTSEAYTSRRMLVRYLSAPNELLGDILWTPAVPGYQASVRLVFAFPMLKARRVRAVQTRGSNEEMWSVSEFRVVFDGKEVPRSRAWRIAAHPNPWDVQLAFDNSAVTRWRTWQAASKGDYLEIDFGGPEEIDGAALECSEEYTNKQVRLEVLDETGNWKRFENPVARREPVYMDLRLAAGEEFKRRGVRYLLLSTDDAGTADMREHTSAWGLRLLGAAGVDQIYRID